MSEMCPRKWLARCGVAAVLILIVLLEVAHQPHARRIRMGKPLPPGKVKPRLVSTWATAVLLAPDGSLWAWGETNSVFPQSAISQIPRRVGSDSDWAQVAGGPGHVVALKNDGSLWAWGVNFDGRVGQTNLAICYNAPTRIGSETNWAQISVGSVGFFGAHTLALKNDGSLWAWGANDSGQLGDGTTNNRSVPTMVGADRDWRTFAAGDATSFALKSNGTLWVWGRGSSSNDLAPKQIESGTNWLSISACDPPHGPALLAIKTDGTLWLNNPPPAYHVAPALASAPTATFTQIGRDRDWAEVYPGEFSFFARKKDGSWWVCGENYGGQLGIGIYAAAKPSPQRLPFDFEPWAFAPGPGTTLLLGKDGRLWSWGKRLGVGKPSAARKTINHWVVPVVWPIFPALGKRIRSDLDRIDRTPVLLWELPAEVRRSLGTGPKSAGL